MQHEVITKDHYVNNITKKLIISMYGYDAWFYEFNCSKKHHDWIISTCMLDECRHKNINFEHILCYNDKL